MTTYHIWTGGDNSDGLTWVTAFTRVVSGTTGKAAGSIFNIADDHSESDGTAKTLPTIGTLANPCYLRCVNRGTGLQSTGATIIVTGAAISINIGAGFWKISGVSFQGGDGTANINSITLGGAGLVDYEDCAFWLNNNQNSSKMVGGTGMTIIRNSTFRFGSSGQGIRPSSGSMVIMGGNIHTSSVAMNPLFDGSSNGRLRIVGFDFKNTIATVIAAQANPMFIEIMGCAFNSAPTLMAATPTGGAMELRTATASSTQVYSQEKINAFGAQKVEMTVVKTGGAIGPDGTGHSMKLIANSNTRFEMPFESLPVVIWNDTAAAARTLTFHGIWGQSSKPANNEIWMEVWYPNSATNINYAKATNRMALLSTTPSLQGNSTWSWGGGTTKFSLATTFTPLQIGPTYIYFYHGLARSSAIDDAYIDTKAAWS